MKGIINMEHNKRFLATFPAKMLDKLDEAKEKTGVSKTALIRLLVTKYLDQLVKELDGEK